MIVAIDGAADRRAAVRARARADQGRAGDDRAPRRSGGRAGEAAEFTVVRRRDRRCRRAARALLADDEARSSRYVRVCSRSRPAPPSGCERRPRELVSGGRDGRVLDLRDNPGGLLAQAVDVASLFLARRASSAIQPGLHEGPQRAVAAGRSGALATLPLVVLVNARQRERGRDRRRRRSPTTTARPSSASARTGRRRCRSIAPLRNGGALKLTTADVPDARAARTSPARASSRSSSAVDDPLDASATRRSRTPARTLASSVLPRTHRPRAAAASRRASSPAGASSSSASRSSRAASPIVRRPQGRGRRAPRRPRRRAPGPRPRAARARARPASRDRDRARGPALARGRPPADSSRCRPSRASSRTASTCATSSRSRSTRRRPRTSTTRSPSAREGDGAARLGAHRRRLALRPGRARRSTATPPSAAFSTYVPGPVEPMLPPELSDDLCSLRPHVERRCVTVEIPFDGDLEPGEPLFYRSVIRSRERLTYGQAEAILAGRERADDELGRGARLAEQLSAELRRRRFARGALRIETGEIAFAFDGEGGVERAWRETRAARARARRGADDPRERGRRRAARRAPPRGALPRPRAARPAVGRAPARRSSPTSRCRRRRVPDEHLTPGGGRPARRGASASA